MGITLEDQTVSWALFMLHCVGSGSRKILKMCCICVLLGNYLQTPVLDGTPNLNSVLSVFVCLFIYIFPQLNELAPMNMQFRDQPEI